MEVLNDRGPTVFIVTLVIISVATLFVVLRLISKWGVTHKANPDDYVVVVGWVFTVGLSVSIMIGTHVGLGSPDSAIKPEWFMPLKQCTYAFTVLYNPAIMATKTAILILYYRIAAAHLFLRYASLFTMAVINIAGIVLTFIYIFLCRPVNAAFSLVDGTCIDIVALYLSSMPINVLTDLAILLLPLPILTSLRMEFRDKVILVATFIVGGFVTIVDVVRIVYLQEALKEELLVNPSASITANTPPPNFTYHASFSLMWSVVEVSVGIMCCCVLVLKPLVMGVMPKLLHAPHIHGHVPSGTPESLLRSNTSEEGRPSDSSPVGDVPFPASVTQPATIPLAPRAAELSRIESPVSPVSPKKPSLSVILRQSTNDEEGEALDFFEMLASEPSAEDSSTWPPFEGPSTHRKSGPRHSTVMSERRATVGTNTSQEPTQNFFDFVQVKGKVPLTQLSAKEAWWPTMFGEGPLTVQIQNLLGYSPSHTIALHDAYWGAYVVGPLLVSYWVLKREGFKATFMTGLAVFATGALSFWPSSVLRSYAGFFVSNFILALGISCLEVAANLFIALAGPGELSEARLNFAQGLNGLGATLSPIVAQVALFAGIDQLDLFRVQWCYFTVALFVVSLAIIFYYVPLSEVGDDDLETMALQRLFNAGLDPEDTVYGVGARRLLLWSGVLAAWFYCGNREAVIYFWTPLVQDIKPGYDSFWSLVIGRSLFTFSRFLAAGLYFVGITPRIVIGVCMLGAFATSVLALVLPQGSGTLAMLLLYSFFEGPVFPTYFAMIMRGQGKHTKFAAAATVTTISGFAFWTSVVYGIQQQRPAFSRSALLVVVILFGISTIWPVILSSRRVLRRWVDPKWSKQRTTESGDHGRGLSSWRRSSPSRRETALTVHPRGGGREIDGGSRVA
ncbi:hypothetical protein EHS25_000952 [Saitozyma podzolica]|uniref:Rhodopsin domain-containing protein n=1 Tax=Saitozyma podzolica TaxID=1890683 RepID=A0A427YXQ5_9TREE|nr:hypothetical protein EHS25_000952 [Saitozyma podzolica]